MSSNIEIKIGKKINYNVPKNVYQFEYSVYHGDDDHDEEHISVYPKGQLNELYFFIWISLMLDDISDYEEFFDKLQSYAEELIGWGYISDYCYTMLGNDVVYMESICRYDYGNLYWYNDSGDKYEVEINGKTTVSRWDSSEPFDRWFIETHPLLADNIREYMSSSLMEEYEDMITAHKMGI